MSIIRAIRIRLAEDRLAAAADALRQHDTFSWSHSSEYNAIERPRLVRRVERARTKVDLITSGRPT